MALTFQIIVGHAQSDGRRYVREIHSDGQGVVAEVEYLAAVGADHTAIATARMLETEINLAESEALRAIGIDAAPTLRFQTGAQFLARLRQVYRTGDRERLCRIARWILRRIADGSVTVAQLRNAFSLTVQQWNTLQAKMEALRDHIEAIDVAVGE